MTVDVRQIAATVKEGFGIAFFPNYLFGFFHVCLDAREGVEIVLDDLFGFLVLNIHALCQSESGNTIDDYWDPR